MGESQPRVEVDLFVSAEKIMVLDIVRQVSVLLNLPFTYFACKLFLLYNLLLNFVPLHSDNIDRSIHPSIHLSIH